MPREGSLATVRLEDLADIEIDTSNMKPSNVSELLFDSLKSHLGVENE